MPLHIRKALLVYCSPAGSTAHVARVMRQKIVALKTPVTMIDLGDDPDIDFIIPQLFDAKDNICLYIGSPVYAAHPIPPIMDFVARMPEAENGYSVPFVTWGAVTSGIALYEMGDALTQKGYRVLGAAKVVARHSMMWSVDAPLGADHPDAEDDRQIDTLLEAVTDKLKKADPPILAPSVLDYQEKFLREQMAQVSFEQAKARFPQKKVLKERCTLCGICVENCPVMAIRLVEAPEIDTACIHCFNCVRLCPEAAIVSDLQPVLEHIRARSEQVKEPACTQIFI
ncbi:MAG: EFR1 family ferrodoxin [Desulfobacterales bacterium]